MQIDKVNFQTPPWLCKELANRLFLYVWKKDAIIWEPTPGAGNLVKALLEEGFTDVRSPEGDFWLWQPKEHPVGVLANFPWSPMKGAYDMLFRCLEYSPEHMIAIMPWLALLNSDKRSKKLAQSGLYKVMHVPRKVFPGVRALASILFFRRGYEGPITFEFLSLPQRTGN